MMMNWFGLLLLLLPIFACFPLTFGQVRNNYQVDAAVKIATCRAHCIDGFSHRFLSLTNSECHSDADCFMCWENCEMFHRSFDVWGSICEDQVVCFDGCQLACTVYKQYDVISTRAADPWTFQRPMSLDRNREYGYLRLDWSQPVPIYSTVPPLPHAVFVVFWRKGDTWIQINQTVTTSFFSQNAEIVGDVSKDFMVLAVTRDGAVAELVYSDKLNKASSSFVVEPTKGARFQPIESQPMDNLRFIGTVVGAASVTCVIFALGMFFGVKIIKDQHRKILLRRANACKIKRSIRCQRHPAEAGQNQLVQVETVTSSTIYANIQNNPPTVYLNSADESQMLNGDNSVLGEERPYALLIVERGDGSDEIRLNPNELKKTLEQQNSIFV